jgi:hypothetical protein
VVAEKSHAPDEESNPERPRRVQSVYRWWNSNLQHEEKKKKKKKKKNQFHFEYGDYYYFLPFDCMTYFVYAGILIA